MSDPLVTLSGAQRWAETGVEASIDADPTIENAARLLYGVQRVRSALALAEDMLAEFVFDTLGTGRYELDDVPPLEVRIGRDRKSWKHDDAAADLVEPIAVEVFGRDDDGEWLGFGINRDGEALDPQTIVACVLHAFRQASSDGWKVTGLRQFGLDPDAYCESSRGRVSVQFL